MQIPSLSTPTLEMYKWLLRFFVVLVVILSIASGYFQALYENEQKKYAKLEDMYVRVRMSLGREETQRLIDISRETENK